MPPMTLQHRAQRDLNVFVAALLCALLPIRGQIDLPQPVEVGADPSVIHDWWFWVGIGLIAAFFLVSLWFVYRGFRNYKFYKAHLEEWEQRAALERLKVEDMPEIDLPSSQTAGGSKPDLPTFMVDAIELARRTGRKLPPQMLFKDDLALLKSQQ